MRLDQYLLKEKFFSSREKAKEAISSGKVFVNGEICTKAAFKIIEGREVMVVDEEVSYVSRSGYKLEAAMKEFSVSAKDKVCLDVGSSTGGFTQCLLNDDAKEVYAVDVGSDQMDKSVSSNKRVHLFEKTDIRDFKFPSGGVADLVVADVSFVSLRKLIPFFEQLICSKTVLLLLFKPQFEVGKSYLKKGIYKDVDIEKILDDFKEFLAQNNFFLVGVFKVPLKGKKGNQEYFLKVIPNQEQS